MDNLAHTLCGALLAKTRLGSASRLAPASLVIGANLPDSDAIARMFGGKEAYLVHHRGLTHSLLGVVIAALLLAATIRFLERRLWRGEAGLPWRAFLLPALAGLASHPLLDLLNTYGLRPWLPFSHARYYGDLVFIVDPLLWLLFGGIAALAGARTRVGSALLGGVAAFATWLVFTHERAPAHVKGYWLVAIAAVAGLRLAGVGRRRPRRVLAIGAASIALYLGGLEVSARLAWRNGVRRPDPAQTIAAGIDEPWRLAMRSPVLGSPFRWTFFLETAQGWHRRQVDVAGTTLVRAPLQPRSLDDPRAELAMQDPRATAWRYFARLPCAFVVEPPDGRVTVHLTDARYQSTPGPLWCSVDVDLPETAAPSGPAGSR